jgi:hypothetical protein
MIKIDPSKLVGSSTSVSPKISSGVLIPKKNLLVIKNQVIEVKNLLQTSTLLKQAELNNQRKKLEREKFQKRENQLEAKKVQPGTKKIRVPGLPKLGFLDRIKNFIFTVLLGRFIVKMLPHASKLANVVKGITTGIEFATDLTIGLINGLSTLVDKGYKAYDATSGFLKNIGGDNTIKLFDGFTKAIDATIIAAIALASMPDPFSSGPDTGKPGKSKSKRTKVTQGKGGQKIRFGVPGTGPKVTGGTPRLPTRGAVTKGGLLGLVTLIPDILNSWDLWQNQGRGKDALRTFFSAVTGAIAGLGAVAAVEAGAAALGVTGVGIPAAIALAVAGFAASSLAGTGAYNLTDGILRRMGLVDNDPETGKPYAYRSGGPVTRGGRFVSGPIRRSVAKKPKRGVVSKVSQLKPGVNVGGKNKIEKVFPEPDPKSKDKEKQVNPLGYIQSSYKKITQSKAFGGLMALPLKALAGQAPTPLDYKTAAQGLNSWINSMFDAGIARQGFAGGGDVNTTKFLGGDDMTDVIAKSLQDNVSNHLNNAINDLMKQLMLKGIEGQKNQPDQPGNQIEGLQGNAKEYYDYLISKGLSPDNALGLVINVERESTYNPGIVSGDGRFIGIFQWGGDRAQKMVRTIPDWRTNWRGQLDYALTEEGEPGPQYVGMKFNSPLDAANWWMREWERTADPARDETRHREIYDRFISQGMRRGQGPPGRIPIGAGDGRFIQGNSGRSDGVHFHIGTNKPNDASHSTPVAFNVIKHFLGKKSVHILRSDERIPLNATDEQIRGYIARGQRAHATNGRGPTEIDIQIGGLDGRKNNVPFPFALNNMNYSATDGYGVSADVVGFQKAFVGHGRYKPDGTLALQQRTLLSSGHPDYYSFHGGPTGKGGLTMTHQGEYIIDKDSVDAFGMDFFDIINQTENMSQRKQSAKQLMGILQLYAGYEAGGRKKIKVKVPAPQVVTVPVPVPVGGSSVMSSSSSGSKPQDINYRG